jgi:hypothetical protein
MRGVICAPFVVLITLACSASQPVAEPVRDSLPASYSLIMINGETVEVNLQSAGWGTKSAVLRARPDGQFEETVVSIRPPGYEPHETETTFHGSWSEQGGRYAFEWTDARVFPMVGTLSGRTLTLRTEAGAERVYRK